MDKRIEEKETAIKGLDAQMKESQAELRHINSSMTTEQMIIMIAKVRLLAFGTFIKSSVSNTTN